MGLIITINNTLVALLKKSYNPCLLFACGEPVEPVAYCF
jgi:hypothetical protein